MSGFHRNLRKKPEDRGSIPLWRIIMKYNRSLNSKKRILERTQEARRILEEAREIIPEGREDIIIVSNFLSEVSSRLRISLVKKGRLFSLRRQICSIDTSVYRDLGRTAILYGRCCDKRIDSYFSRAFLRLCELEELKPNYVGPK